MNLEITKVRLPFPALLPQAPIRKPFFCNECGKDTPPSLREGGVCGAFSAALPGPATGNMVPKLENSGRPHEGLKALAVCMTHAVAKAIRKNSMDSFSRGSPAAPIGAPLFFAAVCLRAAIFGGLGYACLKHLNEASGCMEDSDSHAPRFI